MIETLAMVGTPVQWLFILAVCVVLFAPRMIPVIGRLLGKLVRTEVKRRYGISLGSAPTTPPASPPAVEPASIDARFVDQRSVDHIQPAEVEPGPMEPRADLPRSVDRNVSPVPSQRSVPVWAVTTLAAGAAAVLLWILLHAR